MEDRTRSAAPSGKLEMSTAGSQHQRHNFSATHIGEDALSCYQIEALITSDRGRKLNAVMDED